MPEKNKYYGKEKMNEAELNKKFEYWWWPNVINEEQIEPFLPYIFEKLNWLDREKLIKHFVSTEFNRYLSYYKDSKDINEETHGNDSNKRHPRRKKRNRRKFYNSKNINRKNNRKRRKRTR